VNLCLSRGLSRRREVAIRLAIGASRARLVQQLLIESAILTAIGSALGLVFVLALPRALGALGSVTGDLQIDASPDARVVAYVFAAGIGATLLVGVAPALQATRVDLAAAFKGGMILGRRTIRPARLRAAVVGLQLGGSAVLLVLSALFVRAARRAAATDPGYATKNVVAFALNASAIGYDTTRARLLYGTLIDRLRHSPDVAGVATVGKLPLLSTNRMGISLDEDRAADPELHVVDIAVVSGSYFSTMRMRVVRGTTFDSSALATREREAVVSQAMAARLWPAGDAIGRRFNAAGKTYRVVGIASNAAANTLARTDDAVAYLEAASPLGQQIVVRTVSSPAALIAVFPEWLHDIDPVLGTQAERFENRIALHLLPARLIAGSTATLGALALILAAIGVAGVVSFGLGQRREEVAVRLAVGATGSQVASLMMRQATRPIAIGIGLGMAVAMALGQVMRGFLYGLTPSDPVAFGLMAAVLALTALVATWLPSRRAARVDPARVLRDS
jgi:predicted permease